MAKDNISIQMVGKIKLQVTIQNVDNKIKENFSKIHDVFNRLQSHNG